mmetsp:Transcript_3428/g.9150  ORF Transcript_3428/g.9150 Transcript_3428/m.9150 type:complete len:111 (+) Transcript_3428:182-514(+)
MQVPTSQQGSRLSSGNQAKPVHFVVMVQAPLPHQLQPAPQGSACFIRVAEHNPRYPRVHQCHCAHGTRLPRNEAIVTGAHVGPGEAQRSSGCCVALGPLRQLTGAALLIM